MAFSIYKVIRVGCLLRSFMPRGVNKPTVRQTSHANEFVNPKSHAREKPLFAGNKRLKTLNDTHTTT